MLDSRKHRGQWTRSWQWFAAYGGVIETDVARAGWASGTLLLWNRRSGKLIGFPGCAPGVIQPTCVDFALFLRSLRDPRAIGLGDCALAGMISQPPQLLGVDPRYVCPTRTCDAATSAATPAARGSVRSDPMMPAVARMAPAAQSGVDWRWPKLGPDDWSAMNSICRIAGGANQGPSALPEACEIAKPTNPFDTFDACIIAATGGGTTDDSTVGSEQFPASRRALNANSPTTPQAQRRRTIAVRANPAQTSTILAPASPAKESRRSHLPVAARPRHRATHRLPKERPEPLAHRAAAPALRAEQGDAGTKGDGGTPESADAKRRRELEAIIKAAQQHPENHAAVQAAQDARDELKRMDSFDRMSEIMKGLNKKDCADAGACSDTCTALGRELAAANACTQGLLGAIARATGRPVRSDLPPARPRGPVEHPAPDAPSTSAAVGDADLCLLGAADPAAPNRACGLELCADGILSAGTREGCVCDPHRGAWKPFDQRLPVQDAVPGRRHARRELPLHVGFGRYGRRRHSSATLARVDRHSADGGYDDSGPRARREWRSWRNLRERPSAAALTSARTRCRWGAVRQLRHTFHDFHSIYAAST